MSVTLKHPLINSNYQTADFDPFAGPKLLRAIPTTEPQLEIWLSCVIGGDDANRAYNESVSLNLEGDLDKESLFYSLDEVVKRHELLRATISPDGKSICIYEHLPPSFDFQDLSDLSGPEREKQLANIYYDSSNVVYDLENGPLFKAKLIKLSETRHCLKLSAHHIICDGWSFGIILENISDIYSSAKRKSRSNLSKAISFGHYALELSTYMNSDNYLNTVKYWLDQYSDNVPALNLPTDNERPPVRTFNSQRLDFHVSKSLIDQVRKVGAKSGASLVSTLIVSFETYLHLITGQADIVLGVPAAGQATTGHYELVGHCVNTLPLRSRISGGTFFEEHLLKRKSQILDDYDHQNFTFGSLLTKLPIARDSSRIPLIPVVFNLDMGMDAKVSFVDLVHSLSSDPRSYENFEIFLNVTGKKDELIFEWSYNTYLFNETRIKRMMSEFQGVLEQIVAKPDIKIKDIVLDSNRIADEVNANLEQIELWNNATRAEYPKDKIVTEFISQSASQYSSKTAIYYQSAELSYKELECKSNQLANLLVHLGIKKGAIVGLMVDRSFEMMISLLAIMKSGAAYLPLDPQYPEARLLYMLEDSRVSHLILSDAYLSFPSKCTSIIIERAFASLTEYSDDKPDLTLSGSDLAYILYTSGSTGKPKGVQIEHHSLTNFLLSFQKEPGMSPGDKVLAITTISFDISGLELFLPLITGASLVLVDSRTARDGRALLEVVDHEEISIMQATPTTWQMMLTAGWVTQKPLKALCGGEALSKDLAENLFQVVGELWNVYGPTETTIWSSIKQIKNPTETITIGRPIANTQIYILDEELNPVGNGIAGEIYIAGDGLSRGYLNRQALTSEKFISNHRVSNKEGKMYATGDLGYFLKNGEIVCLGRKDAQIKIRGHRIELGEIEYNLTMQPGIKSAVVTAYGEDRENQQLIAHVIPDQIDNLIWHERWNEIYTEGVLRESSLSIDDQNLDLAIINNDEVDGAVHGKEWTNETLKRLKAIGAKRILELGAGGGHLLFALAQETERYVATDYSEVAIGKLNEKLAASRNKWAHVTAFPAPADDLLRVHENQFDLVLLHSVIQYFPNLEYLLDVIKKSLSKLCDGGCLFIGDSQTEASAYMHIAYEQLKFVGAKATLKDFKDIINFRIRQQNELSVDPGFFFFLKTIIPEITAVDIQIRGGEFLNEGTKSHYDVWIYKGAKAPREIKANITESWVDYPSVEAIETLLLGNQTNVTQISGIPNRRVDFDVSITKNLARLADVVSINELKASIHGTRERASVEPTRFWELGDKLNFHTHIRWANDGGDGMFEIVFIPKKNQNCIPLMPEHVNIKTLDEYLKQDQTTEVIEISDVLVQNWKNGLKAMLPEFMIPKAIIGLNRFPTTENGKIDRRRLPVNEKAISSFNRGNVLPRNATERAIAEIWSEFLSLKEIGIHNNFFELGGHSLTAVRVMLAIEKKFGAKLPISTLFENSTIEKLAKLITGEKDQSKWHSLVPIKTSGDKRPIYLVHGGGFNVLTFEPFSKHMDPDQPIFALQGLGITDKTTALSTIEEIAEFYISEILENDPVGPYALGGYCSGGIIAYEMSRQLLAEGKKVSLLALLDTENYDFNRKASTIRTFKKAAFYLKSFAKRPVQTYRYFKAKAYSSIPLLAQTDEISRYEAEVNDAYYNAFLNYRPEPLDVKIVLLKARERAAYVDDPSEYGWGKFAIRGVETYALNGNHTSFITSPHEKDFAGTFQRIIDRAH